MGWSYVMMDWIQPMCVLQIHHHVELCCHRRQVHFLRTLQRDDEGITATVAHFNLPTQEFVEVLVNPYR